MKINIITLSVSLIVLFSACTPAVQVKKEVKKTAKKVEKMEQNNIVPSWVNPNANLGVNLSVGYAKPVFQGMYMQEQNALNDAKIKLSHKISSVISAKNTEKFLVFNQEISVKSIKDIRAFNKIILNDIEQYDAYIDKDKGLYILVGREGLGENISVSKKKPQRYNKSVLLQSRCYKKEILSAIDTKAPLYKGRPIWFYSPRKKGYYVSIGIAQKNTYDFKKQRDMAILLGKSNMMKKIRSLSSSKLELLEVIRDEESAALYDVWAHHTSSAKVKSVRVEDSWMDPKTCELYVLLYSER
jgi:hypothetical protein